MKQKKVINLLSFILFELLLTVVLFLLVKLLGAAAQGLLSTIGRTAVTSGDMGHILTTWQGWLVLIICGVILVAYTVFDLHALIIMSDNQLNGRGKSIWQVLKESVTSIRYLNRPQAIFLVAYVTFLAPLCGAGIGVSVTNELYMPDFIMSVIQKNRLLFVLYIIGMIVLFIVGIFNIFTYHVMLLDKVSVKDAFPKAQKIFKSKWKDLIKSYLIFLVKVLLIEAAVFVVVFIIPVRIITATGVDSTATHYLNIAFTLLGLLVISVIWLLIKPLFILKLTDLYTKYNNETLENKAVDRTQTYQVRSGKGFWIFLAIAAAAMFIISIPLTPYYNEYFRKTTDSKIVAHRGAGTLAPENSLESIEVASKYGINVAEIDVQRTKDGGYIINHDANFARLCGDDRTPQDMTVEEIKKLEIHDPAAPAGMVGHVPTLEEIYDEAKKWDVDLLVEFKGSTADKQMVDDSYRIAKERNALDKCIFFSLDYDILDYMETNYPDAVTAYAFFFALGDFQNLNVDILGMEEQVATLDNILMVEDAGKGTAVWTCNSLNSIAKYCNANVGHVITDEVERALNYKKLMDSNSEFTRIVNVFLWMLNLGF